MKYITINNTLVRIKAIVSISPIVHKEATPTIPGIFIFSVCLSNGQMISASSDDNVELAVERLGITKRIEKNKTPGVEKPQNHVDYEKIFKETIKHIDYKIVKEDYDVSKNIILHSIADYMIKAERKEKREQNEPKKDQEIQKDS